jgi:formamidopyrimidine-DNA glycosylase
MPELPEVQLAADSLGVQIVGARIVRVERLDWTRMVETPSPDEFITLLAGRQVHGWGRRAKWILLFLDGGWTLALHLRMSGSLTVQPADAPPDKHTHLVLRLDDGRQVFFRDPRKFGRARLLEAAGLAALDAAHGDEPLSGRIYG